MPHKIAKVQVVVHRDGKNHHVPVGKPFEFTADEIKEVLAVHPEGLRDPVNEGAGVDSVRDANEAGGMKSSDGRRMQGGSVEDLAGLAGVNEERGDLADASEAASPRATNRGPQASAPQGRAGPQTARPTGKPGGKAKPEDDGGDDEL